MVIMDWAKLEQIGDAILGEYDRLYTNAELIVWYLSSCTRRIHISRSVPQHYEIPVLPAQRADYRTHRS